MNAERKQHRFRVLVVVDLVLSGVATIIWLTLVATLSGWGTPSAAFSWIMFVLMAQLLGDLMVVLRLPYCALVRTAVSFSTVVALGTLVVRVPDRALLLIPGLWSFVMFWAGLATLTAKR